VILEIADLVARHCGVSEPTARGLRVAFIKTTDPIFLVFAPSQAHPLFVVKVAPTRELERRQAYKARLYDLLPDVIAKPLGVFPVAEGLSILVQNGLAGRPWFRLSDRLRTSADWLTLRERCIGQLHAFQAAVATQPDWVVSATRFDQSLLALADQLDEYLAPLGTEVRTLVSEASSTLEALGPVPATWQHGDFVLNNLLVDERRLGVLDLVDFGKWRVPLLDACALASSLHLHASSHVAWHHVSVDLAAATASAPYTSRQKTAFFVYFLLAAIADTLQRPSRATVRLTYLDLLRDLAADPRRFVGAFERAP
jgi:Phosphotransferase enzyme family